MIAYTSRTGTRSTIAALRDAGWRLLVSAANDLRMEGMPYGLDNGAWTYHQKGLPFDEARYALALDKLAARADWVVVPDVVGNAEATMRLTAKWLPMLPPLRAQRPLVAVQDGMTIADVERLIGSHGRRVGVFLGGSTEWKLDTMAMWGAWCLEQGRYFHVARVNTMKRIRVAADAHASSFDGTSVTRFPVNLTRLDLARRSHGTDCGDPWRDYAEDAALVARELPTYRDDEEVTLSAGALRLLLEAREDA